MMWSWRITFRCNPYRAQSHFLWINAPNDSTGEEIKVAAYQSKWRLPVDIIDEIVKWSWCVDNPDITLTDSITGDGK